MEKKKVNLSKKSVIVLILIILIMGIFVGKVFGQYVPPEPDKENLNGQEFDIESPETWSAENLGVSENLEKIKEKIKDADSEKWNEILGVLKDGGMWEEIELLAEENIKEQSSLENFDLKFKEGQMPKDIRYEIDRDNRRFIIIDANGKEHQLVVTNLPKNTQEISFRDTEGDIYGFGLFIEDTKNNYVYINDGESFVQKSSEGGDNWVIKEYKGKDGNKVDLNIYFYSNNGAVSIGTPQGWKSGAWMWGDVSIDGDGLSVRPDTTDSSAIPNGDSRYAAFFNILNSEGPKVYEVRGVAIAGELFQSQSQDNQGNVIPKLRIEGQRFRISKSNNVIVALGPYVPKEGEEYINIYDDIVTGNLRSGEIESLSGQDLILKRNGNIIQTNKLISFNNENVNVGRDSGSIGGGGHVGCGDSEGSHISNGANDVLNNIHSSHGGSGGGSMNGGRSESGGGSSGSASCH